MLKKFVKQGVPNKEGRVRPNYIFKNLPSQSDKHFSSLVLYKLCFQEGNTGKYL